jgi:hypothetical protein
MLLQLTLVCSFQAGTTIQVPFLAQGAAHRGFFTPRAQHTLWSHVDAPCAGREIAVGSLLFVLLHTPHRWADDEVHSWAEAPQTS